MEQQQQGGSSGAWYGGSPQQPQPQYSGPPPPLQWPGAELHYNQNPQQQQQQMQHPPQPQHHAYYAQQGYYAPQQQQQVPQAPALPSPFPPPPVPPQHGMMYGHPEQVWPANNGWNQQQWSSPGNPTPGLNQEEDWAAKARAWAAAKAAQEAQQQAQQQFQAQSNLVSEQPFPDTPQQPPPLPPPHQLDLSQQFAYQPETGPSGYGHDGPSIYSQDVSHKYGRDAPGHFQEETNSQILEEERNFPQDVSTSGSGLATVPAPLPPRNIVQLVPCSYPQDVPSSHVQDGPAADLNVTVPPGMEQQDLPQLPPPLPPAPAPAAPSSLGHLSHQQPPQPGPQMSPHQQTAHLQPPLPPPQFSFGESAQPPPYDFHQHPPYEYQQQQPHSQDFQQQQPTQFNMVGGLPDSGGYGGLPPPQGWPPQGPFTPSNIGPGLDGGPGLGHQFEYDFEHMHSNHHQHPQHLQGHNMFARPPHGPGFRPGGPPLGHFGFGGSPTVAPGPGAGMDFSVFMDNGHGHMTGLERPKKASVPNWLKEELLKKKSTVAGGGQVSTVEDDVRANGDDLGDSAHNKLEFSERSRSDLSRQSDTEDEDEEEDMEAMRTAAMNQEIKRVLTEVLLKVTDDLFDEIAQEVMDEDEQRLLEEPGKKILVHEDVIGANPRTSLPAATAPAPVRVLVAPVAKSSKVGSDDDSESLSSGVPAGNLLGLASYASDDEDGGRSRQLNETEQVEGGNSDTEASGFENIGADKAKKDLRVKDAEVEVGHVKEIKGKKRLSEEIINPDHHSRSPRRARHTEIGSGYESGPKDAPASMNSDGTDSQMKSGVTDSQDFGPEKLVEDRMLETAEENKHNQRVPPHKTGSSDRRRSDTRHEHQSKGRSSEEVPHSRRLQKEDVISNKNKDEHEEELRSAHENHVVSSEKQGGKEVDGDGEHKNSKKREKENSRDTKEKGRDREAIRGKERDQNIEKIKERERGSDRDKHKERVKDKEREKDKEKVKDKEREKSSKSRGRESERERCKSTSDTHDRKSAENRKEIHVKRVQKRRSLSLSSRGRSPSRTSSGSGSQSSSRSPARSGTPRRRQQKSRSSKQSSLSSAAVRSRRRRTSRSPSRSVPHSKVSHRRHSPSPSREKERHRRSRSASPAHKRRRS